MIARFGFLVAASIAAYAVKQLNLNASKSSAPLTKPSENGEANFEQQQNQGKDKQQFSHSDDGLREKNWEEEEEEEEVKLISSIFNRARGSPPNTDDEDILPEFEDLFDKDTQSS